MLGLGLGLGLGIGLGLSLGLGLPSLRGVEVLVGEDEQKQREIDRRHGVHGIEDRLQLRARAEGEGGAFGLGLEDALLDQEVRVRPHVAHAGEHLGG